MALSMMTRILVGALLILHGFAHYELPTLWGTRPAHISWLLGGLAPNQLQSPATILWIAALVLFLAAGVLEWFNRSFWRVLTIAGATVSLVVMVLFWDPQMVLGVIVNCAVLAALLGLKWPARRLIR